jgi:hypothetical protein
VEISEGEEGVLAGGLGLPSFHRRQTNETRGKRVLQILDTPREIPSRYSSLSWSACKKKEEGKR